MEGLKLTLVEYLKILVSPFLQPGQVPLNSSLALLHFDHSSAFGLIHEIASYGHKKLQEQEARNLSQLGLLLKTINEIFNISAHFVHFVLSKLWTHKPNSSLIYSSLSLKPLNLTLLQYCNATLHVRVRCMHTHPHRWLKRCNNWNGNTAEFGGTAGYAVRTKVYTQSQRWQEEP